MTASSRPAATPAAFEAAGPAIVPARLADAAKLGPGWVERLAWPLPFPAVVGIVKATLDRYVDAVLAIDDPDARAVALMCRRFMTVHALVQFAHLIAADGGRNTFGGPDDLDVLTGRRTAEDFRTAETDLVPAARPLHLRFLRRAARTATWTPWWRLPRALAFPDAVALDHNSLLRDYVAGAGRSVRLAYSEEVLSPADPADPGLLKRIDAPAVGRQLAAALAASPDLPAQLRDRLTRLFEPMLAEAAQAGLEALARLRAKRRLPRYVLTGTGSRFESRALGMEVIRRGGEVVRFGHAGAYPLMNSPAFLVQQELAVSSRLVLCTPEAAAMPNVRAAQARAGGTAAVAIEGHSGDPGLVPTHWRAQPRSGGRRRVMYVATAYFGFNQLFPPALPEPLYFAWQTRLAALLRGLDVEVIFKPHPEGVRPAPGIAAPFETVLDGRFEAVSDRTDVFLFDHPATTSLAVALSTEQPIVLIDLGNMDFNPEAAMLLGQRCRVIRAEHDAANQPVVEPEELADALFDDGPVDPLPFRRLYLGGEGPA